MDVNLYLLAVFQLFSVSLLLALTFFRVTFIVQKLYFFFFCSQRIARIFIEHVQVRGSGIVLSTFHMLTNLIFTTNPVKCILRFIPILQIRKGRHQGVEKLVKGHIAKRGSQDETPGNPRAEPSASLPFPSQPLGCMGCLGNTTLGCKNSTLGFVTTFCFILLFNSSGLFICLLSQVGGRNLILFL